MKLDPVHITELKELCPEVRCAEEGGKNYLLLPQLNLPDGVTPSIVNALLCTSERDGYQSRLFFPVLIETPKSLNWNAQNVPILGGSWFAYSWRTRQGLRPAQMILEHLSAFR